MKFSDQDLLNVLQRAHDGVLIHSPRSNNLGKLTTEESHAAYFASEKGYLHPKLHLSITATSALHADTNDVDMYDNLLTPLGVSHLTLLKSLKDTNPIGFNR